MGMIEYDHEVKNVFWKILSFNGPKRSYEIAL